MFSHAAAIGADIGRFSIKVAVVRIGGETIALKSFPMEEVQTRDYVISVLLKAIADVRQSVAASGINPICIGIAAKGFIDQKGGVVLGPDQGIEGWTGVPLASAVNRETGLPVYIGNDANMMTIAEHRFGAARGFRNVIFVALRTGIGGGIIIDGKLYRGVNNAGAEVGQMIIKYDDIPGEKGIKGSYEQLASATAVVRRYYEETGEKSDEHTRKLSCRDVFELCNQRNEIALKVIRENAALVGIGLANLITIFAPEIIVIGGGMSEAGDWYIRMIRQSAFDNSLENCRTEVKIERALLGASGSLMGSAYHAMTRLAGRVI